MHPILKTEFDQLPEEVRETFRNIVSSLRGPGSVYVSSVRSNQKGERRTKQNGPNHYDMKAIDFVITPFMSPVFMGQDGEPRSPQFHWNISLQDYLTGLFDSGKIKCLVYIEPDHIHLDSNHPPGVKVYTGGKSCYLNSRDIPMGSPRTLRGS